MSDRHKMLNADGSRTFDRALSEAIVAKHRAMVSARLAEADAPVVAIKAAAMPPAICGPDIPASPARGAYRVFRPVEIVPGSSGTARPAGYRGPGEATFRAAIQIADVFDAMREDARRRHEKRVAKLGDDAGPFIPPFTPGQEQVARDYRDLVERQSAGGIKCASLEAGRRGGGQGEFIDAYIADGIWLAQLKERIGTGIALATARSGSSPMRRAILCRTLVDMVCLRGWSLTVVLRKHDWTVKAQSLDLARNALARALDRMQGYRDAGTQDMA